MLFHSREMYANKREILKVIHQFSESISILDSCENERQHELVHGNNSVQLFRIVIQKAALVDTATIWQN